MAATPIEPVASIVAVVLGSLLTDSVDDRGGPGSLDPLPATAGLWAGPDAVGGGPAADGLVGAPLDRPLIGDGCAVAGLTAEPNPELAALPAEPGPAGLPAGAAPAGLPAGAAPAVPAADAPHDAPDVAGDGAPPVAPAQDGVAVVGVVDDVTGGDVDVTGVVGGLGGGGVVVDGAEGGVVVVVVTDPAGCEVVVDGAWVGGGVVGVVAGDEASTAGDGVELGSLVAVAPPSCTALSAQASGLGSASTRHNAIESPSKTVDERRLIAVHRLLSETVVV